VGVPQTADIFQRNSSSCGKPDLLAPYFRLFQRRVCAPGSFPGWTAS